MNFQKVRRKNRKAISPVLATVILIAITLIAAIAIAGFVFGLFGTFTSGANLQVTQTACVHGNAGNVAGSGYCTIYVANTGGASGSITGCSIYGTAGVSVQQAPAAPPVVGAVAIIPAGTASPGLRAEGSLRS